MAHDRLVTAMNPTWECRLRLSKRNPPLSHWPRGSDPSGGATRKKQLSLILSDPGSPRDSAEKRPEPGPQHPAGKTPDPHFLPANSGFGQDPPPGPRPRGNTEEDLGLTQDRKAKVEKVLDKTSGTPTPTSREPWEPVE